MKNLKNKTTSSTPTKLTTIYIGNLNYEISNRDLKRLFSEFGMVKSAKLVLDKDTEKSKGIAFIQMFNEKEALKAIKDLDGKIYEGRTLKVSIANDRFAQKSDFKPEKKITKTTPVKTIKTTKKPGLDVLFNYLKTKK